MFGLLAIIGLIAVLLWLSKGLKKVGRCLINTSEVCADLIEIHKKKSQNNRIIIQQNKNAESKLQSITGGISHAAYSSNVRKEIDEILKEIGSSPKS